MCTPNIIENSYLDTWKILREELRLDIGIQMMNKVPDHRSFMPSYTFIDLILFLPEDVVCYTSLVTLATRLL